MRNSATRFAQARRWTSPSDGGLSECARVLASLSERLIIRKAMRGGIALQKDFVRNRLVWRFRRSRRFRHRLEYSA
jgi:hypothetical protein